MVNKNSLFSFLEYSEVNQDKKLGSVNYLHALFKLANLPNDLVVCFSKLFMPKFKVVDNLIFLSELFDSVIYEEYTSEGKSKSEIQLWINLIEITAIFEELGYEEAEQLASEIVQMWNLILKDKLYNFLGTARVISEEGNGEIFITIDQFNS